MSDTAALKHYFGAELAHRLSGLIQPHASGFPWRRSTKSPNGICRNTRYALIWSTIWRIACA